MVVAPGSIKPHQTGFICNLERFQCKDILYEWEWTTLTKWFRQSEEFQSYPMPLGDVYRTQIQLQKFTSNLAADKTAFKKSWSTLSKALDWSKLINTALLFCFFCMIVQTTSSWQLCLERWFLPGLMILSHVPTTSFFISLQH